MPHYCFENYNIITAKAQLQYSKSPLAPQLEPKTKRRLRSVALASLAVFAVFFILLSYVVCSLSAGSLEFWHVWGWFGYGG